MNSPQASLAGVHVLDNAVWSALSTEQAYLAQGNALAKRFPRDVSPFAAMSDQSPAAYQALAAVLAAASAFRPGALHCGNEHRTASILLSAVRRGSSQLHWSDTGGA